ncbi:hypothetical protein HPB50_012986 [Hyalomma asiaticum]|uniref:Uncharacterized protein n=1 Tax=Hyalomma asiaticum TaxID=266040 RepID=A0ACB7SHC9_HYAAI|nr:hypothetical protein HPB50_012986 [Hyalomma asiaticum]
MPELPQIEETNSDSAADSVVEHVAPRKKNVVVIVWSTGVAVGAIVSSLLGAAIFSKGLGSPGALLQAKHVRVCETDDCYLAADTFKTTGNHSVDPCDDFYAYVCGSSKKPPGNTMDHVRTALAA